MFMKINFSADFWWTTHPDIAARATLSGSRAASACGMLCRPRLPLPALRGPLHLSLRFTWGEAIWGEILISQRDNLSIKRGLQGRTSPAECLILNFKNVDGTKTPFLWECISRWRLILCGWWITSSGLSCICFNVFDCNRLMKKRSTTNSSGALFFTHSHSKKRLGSLLMLA